MKFSVGQKVRIKSLDWYNENTNECGYIMCGCVPFNTNMSIYCGKVLTIDDANEEFSYYKMKECEYVFTDEMIEGLAEETKPKFKVGDKITNGKVTLTILTLSSNSYVVEDTFGECGTLYFKFMDNWKLAEVESEKKLSDESWRYKNIFDCSQYPQSFECPDGYIFKDENGNVINATKIVLEKKKEKYPKTYEECCKVLGIDVRDLDILDNMLDTSEIIYRKNLDRLLNSFRKLLICRDAYWKIAGEEMGLGKPWEPDWNIRGYYAIARSYGNVVKTSNYNCDLTFVFPTEEMRDAFCENFKELIESCKELL